MTFERVYHRDKDWNESTWTNEEVVVNCHPRRRSLRDVAYLLRNGEKIYESLLWRLDELRGDIHLGMVVERYYHMDVGSRKSWMKKVVDKTDRYRL